MTCVECWSDMTHECLDCPAVLCEPHWEEHQCNHRIHYSIWRKPHCQQGIIIGTSCDRYPENGDYVCGSHITYPGKLCWDTADVKFHGMGMNGLQFCRPCSFNPVTELNICYCNC